MLPRFVAATIAVALAVGLAACQPEPEPSPTGPVFASEEEAFAAAEETYRAYVDALNQVDLSDPETFEAVYAWTTGDANAGEKKSLTGMHADGWSVRGETRITSFEPVEYSTAEDPVVLAETCTDVSEVQVLDASGTSVVAPDRPTQQATRVQFTQAEGSPTQLQIASIEGGDHDC